MAASCIAFAIVGCASSQAPGPQRDVARQDLPKGLSLPADASDVKVRRREEATDVAYKVDREFPAEALLKDISDTLSASGFTPMASDWLNPTIPNSHSRGWGPYIDGTVKPNVAVHVWLAQWRDSLGNVVVYQLQYRSKLGTSSLLPNRPDSDSLSVNAGWIPAEMAKEMMDMPAPPDGP